MDYCVSIYDFWTSMCEHVQRSKFCENASGLLLMPEVSAQYVWCAGVQGSCNDLWSWSSEYQYSRIQDAGAAKQVAGFLPRFYQINPDLRQMSQGKQRKGHTRGHWLRYIVTFWVTPISFHSLLPPLFASCASATTWLLWICSWRSLSNTHNNVSQFSSSVKLPPDWSLYFPLH